jgi:hypothetical protein
MSTFAFRNDYQPPAPANTKPPTHGDTPPEEYDHNFNGGPVPVLSSSKVTLVPFIPAWHARHYAHHLQGDEELVKWMPYSPNPAHGYEELLECYEKVIRAVPVQSFPALSFISLKLTSSNVAHRAMSSLRYSIPQERPVQSRLCQASFRCQTGIPRSSLSLE